jgi:hypothetical protein
MFALWCVLGAVGLTVALVGAVCAVWAPILGTVMLVRDLVSPPRAGRRPRAAGWTGHNNVAHPST